MCDALNLVLGVPVAVVLTASVLALGWRARAFTAREAWRRPRPELRFESVCHHVEGAASTLTVLVSNVGAAAVRASGAKGDVAGTWTTPPVTIEADQAAALRFQIDSAALADHRGPVVLRVQAQSMSRGAELDYRLRLVPTRRWLGDRWSEPSLELAGHTYRLVRDWSLAALSGPVRRPGTRSGRRSEAHAPSTPPSAEERLDGERARELGRADAEAVGAGERVVRAILAHHAVPTFQQIWPALDLDEYLAGYRDVPGSTPPMDRRRAESHGPYDGPRRRADDAPG